MRSNIALILRWQYMVVYGSISTVITALPLNHNTSSHLFPFSSSPTHTCTPIYLAPPHTSAHSESYDTIYGAFLTTYEISTFENWASILYAVRNSRGIDMQPVFNNSPALGLLVVVVAFVTGYIMNGFFVGCVYDTFLKLREESSGGTLT